MSEDDDRFLRLAIRLATEAGTSRDRPFGAVLVRGGEVVASSTGREFSVMDPTQHAELVVISNYCRETRSMWLPDVTIYSSTEPCPMCAGAIRWSGISRAVFSVRQETLTQLFGGYAPISSRDILAASGYDIEVVGPLLEDEGIAAYRAVPPEGLKHTMPTEGPPLSAD